MFNTNKLQRFIIAGSLASGLMSIGIAASAQTTATPASTTTATTAAASDTVAISMNNGKLSRKADIAQADADARRVEFRYEGTSL